jgi:hypothetical protein
MRARLEAVRSLRQAGQQLSSFLLRHGHRHHRPAWRLMHGRWMAGWSFEQAAHHILGRLHRSCRGGDRPARPLRSPHRSGVTWLTRSSRRSRGRVAPKANVMGYSAATAPASQQLSRSPTRSVILVTDNLAFFSSWFCDGRPSGRQACAAREPQKGMTSLMARQQFRDDHAGVFAA